MIDKHGHKPKKKGEHHHEHVNKYPKDSKDTTVSAINTGTGGKSGHNEKEFSNKHEFDRKQDKKHDDKS